MPFTKQGKPSPWGAVPAKAVSGQERRYIYPTLFSFPQEAEIDNIHQLVVGATENIKEGNEDIREVDGLWGLLGRGSCMVLLAPCGEGLAVDCGVDFAC